MCAYIVALVKVHDKDAYDEYGGGWSGAALKVFQDAGGEFLTVEPSPVVLEGEWPYTNTTVIKFPDLDAARRLYYAGEYQAIAQDRFRGADSQVVLVNGL